ncbi:MAG: hypothetical protein NC410_08940 [Oscillibacter sp.]|nr:hypothetical protein [Oscillibacter sp.]
MLKSYILIYDFSLSTPIDVNGKSVTVVFSGGSKPLRQNGEFCTSDEKLQKAIESDPGYGKIFKLYKTYESNQTVKREKKVSLKEVSFTTVNEAAEWLVSKGYSKSDVATSEKAIAAAKELGYDLKFEKE